MRKNLSIPIAAILLVIGAAATIHLRAQKKQEPEKQTADCPMMKKHAHDMAGMNARGDQGMGFSQDKTKHHFYLTKTGGIIQVEANNEKDMTSRDQIRGHLGHIARMFAEGNFDIPMFVHEGTPAGVADMQRLKAVISYHYEDTKQGGRVVMTSPDRNGVSAIQSFLRFQITEHMTGDALEVERD
jgi:hypothetical protein